jgi:hypothetical protein
MGVCGRLKAKTVLYLHGFASSSQSEKAVLIRKFFHRELSHHQLLLPDLPYTPQEADELLQHICRQTPPDVVIGSSLGGFLATRLAEQFNCQAVLINPAVHPHLLLRQHLGRYYHPVLAKHYDVDATHLPILAAQQVQRLAQPSQYLVLLQTGDEVLDYRQALEFYTDCHLDLTEGGDHGYQDFESRLPDIVKFCQLA